MTTLTLLNMIGRYSGPHNAYIADSGPALECTLSTSSSNTALERALSSFNLRLMMVTEDARVIEDRILAFEFTSVCTALQLSIDQYGCRSNL